MIESADDRAVYVNPVEFGVSALYGSTTIAGIYDSDYYAVEVGLPVPIEGARHRFLCRSADLPEDIAHGETLTISGIDADFAIREIHPDGSGMTTLVLEKQ